VPPGPHGAIDDVGGALKRFPDLHVNIEELIAEDGKVAVRNPRTDSPEKRRNFTGVFWRIAHEKIVERWVFLEALHRA
jgi:predicted SnoaL-like aldol condensation-catalyzing enzyme